MKYCPQINPAIGKMNQSNNGKAENPPALPMKWAKNKSNTGIPKSVPLKRVPITDITPAMIIIHLFEMLNFFKIPIKINDKPAKARISTQNSNSPPAIGKISHLPKSVPQTKPGRKNSNTFTKMPRRYNFTPLYHQIPLAMP